MNKQHKYEPLIKNLKDEGYEVYILYMNVDKETSMKRTMGRYQSSGRYVPRQVIEQGAAAGLDVFNRLKNEVAGYVLVDGVTQEIIEKGGKEIPADRNYQKLCCDDDHKQPAAQTEDKPVYSWKTATPVENLKPVVLHCQHYHLKVEHETPVIVKGSGQESMTVTARPGEHLIFDDKGRLVYVMNAASFERKCNEGRPVDKHIKDEHRQPGGAEKKPSAKTSRKRKAAKAKPAEGKAEPPKQEKQEKAKPEKTQVSKKEEKPENTGEELKKIAAKLQKAKDEQKVYTEAEIIRMGKELQPAIQSAGGVTRDVQNKNRRVLAPTLDNLLRWAQNPGRYDLVGVDIARNAKPTVIARLAKKTKVFNLMGIK